MHHPMHVGPTGRPCLNGSSINERGYLLSKKLNFSDTCSLHCTSVGLLSNFSSIDCGATIQVLISTFLLSIMLNKKIRFHYSHPRLLVEQYGVIVA